MALEQWMWRQGNCQYAITLTDQDRNGEGLNRDNNKMDGEKKQI